MSRIALLCSALVVLALLAGCGGKSSSSTTTATVSSITVAPTTASVAINGQQTFTATALDSSGNSVSGVTFTWASSASNVATINSSGVATGVAAGSTQITAAANSVTSSAATLTVAPTVSSVSISPTSATVPVGGTQVFTATAKDASGNVITGVTFTWFNSFAGVAQIHTNPDGTMTLTGISPGTVVITAGVGSVTSPSATVTVTK